VAKGKKRRKTQVNGQKSAFATENPKRKVKTCGKRQKKAQDTSI